MLHLVQLLCVLKSYLDVLRGADLSAFSGAGEMLVLTGLLGLLPVPDRPSGAGDSGQENVDSRLALFTSADTQQLTCSEGSAS